MNVSNFKSLRKKKKSTCSPWILFVSLPNYDCRFRKNQIEVMNLATVAFTYDCMAACLGGIKLIKSFVP